MARKKQVSLEECEYMEKDRNNYKRWYKEERNEKSFWAFGCVIFGLALFFAVLFINDLSIR